jgi:hypothetical protein
VYKYVNNSIVQLYFKENSMGFALSQTPPPPLDGITKKEKGILEMRIGLQTQHNVKEDQIVVMTTGKKYNALK